MGGGEVERMESHRSDDLALCDSAEYISDEELEQIVRIPRLAPIPVPRLLPLPEEVPVLSN